MLSPITKTRTGYNNAAEIDPRETILETNIITKANIKQINPILGSIVNIVPSEVAIPFPPLKP
jgi:hypothetical protein